MGPETVVVADRVSGNEPSSILPPLLLELLGTAVALGYLSWVSPETQGCWGYL